MSTTTVNDAPLADADRGIPKAVADDAEKSYSVFTAHEKWTIVVITAFAGLMR